MQKKLSHIYLLTFLFLTIGVLVISPFMRPFLDLNNYENHKLVTLEDVKEAEWLQKTSLIEEYFNEHLPYKNELTKFNTLIDMNFFKSSDTQVLLGKNKWLFFKKDKCVEDYCGTEKLTEDIKCNTLDAMVKLSSFCKQNNIHLVFLITPNKEEIYGDLYMPSYIKVKNNDSRADILIKYLKIKSDLQIIYPVEELKEARDQGYQVYKKYDTHWNPIGAFVGSNCLLKELNLQTDKLQSVKISEQGTSTGDLANMLAIGSIMNDDVVYTIENYKNNVKTEIVEDIPQEALNYTHYKSTANNQQTIMCIGDSFLGAMEPYIASNFEESYFLHREHYEKGMLILKKPDIVVITSTERGFPGLFYSINNILETENYK